MDTSKSPDPNNPAVQDLMKRVGKQQKEKSVEQMADKVLQAMDEESDINSIRLPSAFQPNQTAYLEFNKGQTSIAVVVKGVHFYVGKVKYDLEVMLDGNTSTRIYNVDSVFVRPV